MREWETLGSVDATQVEPERVSRGGRKGSSPMVPESPAEMAAMMEAGEA